MKSTEGLNEKQIRVFDHVVNAVLAGMQTFVLVNGGPGTGKSFLAGRIVDYLSSFGHNSIATSFMWAAVYQLKLNCPRMSLHALWKANPKSLVIERLIASKKWSNLLQIRATIANARFLLIDDISTTNLELWVALDVILRLAFDPYKPFGSLTVLCLGDFL